MNQWYLSFVDLNKPKGAQWIGAAVVDTDPFDSINAAIKRAKKLNLFESAEVMGIPCDKVQPEYMNRLLTKEEALMMDCTTRGNATPLYRIVNF